MPESCPNCGNPIEWDDGVVRARTGHCGSCDRAFSVLEQAGTEPPVASEGEEDASPSAPTLEGLECEECGAPLELSREGSGLRAQCPDGHVSQVYLPGRGPRADRDEGRARSGGGPPRGRPCRECGGEIRFAELPDGRIQGTCSSCGNRFTLAPRRGGPGGSSGGWSGGSGGRGGRRPWGGGGGRGYDRPSRGGYRRRPPRRRNYDGDGE